MLSDAQVFSETFHMVCSSARCISIVEEVLQRREELRKLGKAPSSNDASRRPVFVWEPVPDLCTPEEQEKFFAAAQVVDVVSPNELELGMMFGQEGWSEESESGRELVKKILTSGVGPEGAGHLIIRAGKHGSYAYSKTQRLWLPAYHEPNTPGAKAVADPTGAGNSYLGALAQGIVSDNRHPVQVVESILAKSDNWKKATESSGERTHIAIALIFATVAAGFVVEQIGIPKISTSSDGSELWNGTEFTERVRLYTQRLYRTLEESPQMYFQMN